MNVQKKVMHISKLLTYMNILKIGTFEIIRIVKYRLTDIFLLTLNIIRQSKVLNLMVKQHLELKI